MPFEMVVAGITLMDAVKKFDTEEKAETWFLEQRWPSDVACPFCGTLNVAVVASRKPQPFRCREKECRKSFSVKTGTLLHSSNLPLSKWAIAFFLYATNLNSDDVAAAAHRYRRGGADFSDLMILAAAERAGARPLYTFDRGLGRMDGAVLLGG